MSSIITQLRKFRIFNIALFDIIGSVLGLYLLLRLVLHNKPAHFYWAWSVVLTLPLGIIAHVLFDTPTTLNYYLGLSVKP